MARSRRGNLRPGLMLLALVIAIFLWGVAQGSTDVRYSFDIPVEIHGVDESLVVTDQSVTDVNVGVQGSRAALRNLDGSRIKYEIDVSNVKPGVAEFEVDLASIELPRRARFVSHSPSRIQVRLENRGRKEVSVKPDIQGSPAEGFVLAEVRVVPDRIWLAGARSHVMRIADVQTEPIDVTGLTASSEVQARIVFGGATTVWSEDGKPVTVQVVVEPILPPEPSSLEIEQQTPPAPADKEAGLPRSRGGRREG